MLGPNSALAIGTLVPNTGSIDQRRVRRRARAGRRRPTTRTRRSASTPRVGAAWDVKGNQKFVVRGGAGLFFDRPPANTVYSTVNNPPFTRNVTVRYGELQNLSATGLATEARAVADGVAVRQPAAGVDAVERAASR